MQNGVRWGFHDNPTVFDRSLWGGLNNQNRALGPIML